MKRKIEEGERTATTLVARKNAATAQRKVSEAMAGVGRADNAFSALNRFEETVAKEEATAKAFDQLASAGKDDDLEAQFAQLGRPQRGCRTGGHEGRRQGGSKAAAPYIPKELAAPRTMPSKRPKKPEKRRTCNE